MFYYKGRWRRRRRLLRRRFRPPNEGEEERGRLRGVAHQTGGIHLFFKKELLGDHIMLQILAVICPEVWQKVHDCDVGPEALEGTPCEMIK